jgi:glyoxylase-like metal-dependent hydrolase (beta-lactamase superfamily II)
MNDVSSVPSAAAAQLSYPLGAPPLPGESCEVAPGVHWLRMPLPMSLNHINLWALEDGDGWTLIDTGMRTDEIASAWQNIMSELMANRPVKRVICTHMHPDHIGMAGWLTRRFDCQLWITRLEYLTCRTLVSDMGREAPADALRFYHAAGWDGESIERYKTRFGHFGKVVYTLPDSFRRIADGEKILIGGRTWHVVVGRGHSPEHACLYCPELGVLISGDQVLPKITSNVSVFPTEPEADPLTDWLESLAAIRRAIPDDVLVLPSHNEPFRGLHARIQQLIEGHEQALQRVKEALAEPKTATDIFSILFRRRVAGDLLSMATGESVAHLNCLIHRGEASRTKDNSGVFWYRSP